MPDEVLVTEFRMVDHYSAGVQKANTATKGFLASAKGLGAGMAKIGGFGLAAAAGVAGGGGALLGFANAASELAAGIAAGVAAGGGALLAFANAASEASASFDTMKRTFAGALGGIEAGTQAMSYLESYATKSAFGLEDLARASAQLAASGLDVNRFLPIIERFALVTSGVDPQGLIQVAGALARVKGGSFGEAFEVFRKAGVGAQDLRAQGVNVTKAGEIQGTSDQVFDAIQKISEGRLKTIADSISGGAENIRANVSDVAGQLFRQIGDEVNQLLLPFLKSFTADMSLLVKSGVVPFLTDIFLGLGSGLKSSSTVLENFFVGLAQASIRLKYFVDSIGYLIDVAKTIASGGRDQEAVDRVLKFSAGVKSGILDSQLKLSEAQIRNRFRNARETPDGPAPAFPAAPQPDPRTQDPVARNTAKLVDLAQKSLDLQRQILGGGARAEEAASPVRIGAALGTNNPMTGKPERLLLQFAAELRAEMLGHQLGIARNSGMPNRVARR